MNNLINKNIISLDLEFTQPSKKIIQIGACVGNLNSGIILKEYQVYINPNEQLSPYIINLTGIKQSDIDNGINIFDAYNDLINIHQNYNCFRNAIVWGGGDSEFLRQQLNKDEETFLFGRRWIDVKTVFISYMWSMGIKGQAGLARALTKLGLQFKGRKHSAIDDAKNTFIIYRELLMRFKNN